MKSLCLIFSLFIFFTPHNAIFSQTNADLTEICTFPTLLKENSGILIDLQGHVWVHNDSGHEPELYKVDTACQVIRTLRVTNAANIDWEDITSDRQGRVFIGDFGNNNNNRQDLTVYIIPDPSLIMDYTVSAEVITFVYESQTAFPPPDTALNYDMEAMIFFQDTLYLFTKNRTSPFDGYTRMYALPAQSGHYTAQYKDRFFCGTGPMELYWITAADISPDNSQLMLLSSNKIWKFYNFSGSDFFKGDYTLYQLNHVTQKEGLAFVGNDSILVSDELFEMSGFLIGGKLYGLGLQSLQSIHSYSKTSFNVFPNPFVDSFFINLKEKPSRNTFVKITDINGKIIKTIKSPKLQKITEVNHSFVKGQVFFVNMYQDGHLTGSAKIIKE